MIEAFAFTWYLLTAAGGVQIGVVQAEDAIECEAAREDKSRDLSAQVAGPKGEPRDGEGWLVGGCRRVPTVTNSRK